MYSFTTRGEQTTNATAQRHVAWTMTQCTVNAEEQTSFLKWMSKDDRGEVAKFADLSWFHSIAKRSKLAEQWKDSHWVGKLKRADEQLLVIRGLTRSVIAGRKQVRDEQWNVGSVKAVLNRIQESEANTEIVISRQTGVHHESSVG